MMKYITTACWLVLASASAVLAQSNPNLQNKQVPTPAQWNSYFSAKQDVLGYTPVNKAGDVMTGKLITAPSSTVQSGFNIPPGVAPTVPTNGDIWETTSGIFARVNGATIGPLTAAASASFAGTSPVTVTFPSGVVTYSLDFTVANTWLAQQNNQGATTTSPGWYAQITGDTVPRARIGLNATDIPSIAFGPGSGNRDTFIERSGVASVRYGAPDAAAPIAQTLGVQNVVAGTTNTAGANLTINGSQGTGTGTGGSIIFQVAPAGSTGSAQNALSSALTLNSAKLATFGGHLAVEGVTSTGATGSGQFVFGTAPSVSSLTVTGAFTATGLVTNADLANASTTVNGTSCTLGASCTATAAAGTLTGTTLNATVVTSSLTSVGALGGGSATTGFTIAASNVTWTGTIPGANQAATNLAAGGNGGVTGLLGLSNLATISADNIVGNFTAGTASPSSIAINNCSNALTYSTTTHTFGCNGVAGTGTVTNVATAGLATGGPITTNGTITVTAAVKSDQTTGSSTTVAVVPGVQQFHPSAVKTWCVWTGTTTGTNACNGSYNVTNVTRVSTGVYTVNFTTAFTSATTYECNVSIDDGGGGGTRFPMLQSAATGSIGVATFNTAFVAVDVQRVHISCNGTQ